MRTREEMLEAKRVIAAAVRGTGTGTTDDFSAQGGLKVEEVKAFITVMQEAGKLGGLVNWKQVGAKSGTLPRRQFGSRLLRGAGEGVAPGSYVKPDVSHIDFACKKVRLAWDTTEEVFLYGVEGEDYEASELEGFMNTFGLDLIDLGLNGETATDPSDPDYDFLKVVNGWLYKIANLGGNVVDATALAGGTAIGKHIYTAAINALPNTWQSRLDKYIWIHNPTLLNTFIDVLSDVPSSMGDLATMNNTIENETIKGVKYIREASMPVDQLLLVDPAQLAMIYNRNMKLRRTSDGVTAASEDKRFSFLIGDYDPVVYWPEACVLVTGITLV